MSEVMIIKQIPVDLKQFWAAEAKRHDRSMNREVLRVLEEERTRRQAAQTSIKNIEGILAAASTLQSFAVLDDRSIDELLYDENGMPK